MEVQNRKEVAFSQALDITKVMILSSLEGAPQTTNMLSKHLAEGELKKIGVTPRTYFNTIIQVLTKLRNTFPIDPMDVEHEIMVERRGIESVKKKRTSVISTQTPNRWIDQNNENNMSSQNTLMLTNRPIKREAVYSSDEDESNCELTEQFPEINLDLSHFTKQNKPRKLPCPKPRSPKSSQKKIVVKKSPKNYPIQPLNTTYIYSRRGRLLQHSTTSSGRKMGIDCPLLRPRVSNPTILKKKQVVVKKEPKTIKMEEKSPQISRISKTRQKVIKTEVEDDQFMEMARSITAEKVSGHYLEAAEPLIHVYLQKNSSKRIVLNSKEFKKLHQDVTKLIKKQVKIGELRDRVLSLSKMRTSTYNWSDDRVVNEFCRYFQSQETSTPMQKVQLQKSLSQIFDCNLSIPTLSAMLDRVQSRFESIGDLFN